MRTVAEILAALSDKVPGDKAAAWDRHGLQLGDAGAPVARVGVCHEVTEAVVESAVSTGVDLLITYHPLIFRPLHHLVAGSGPGGRAYRLVAAGVAVATVHTAWDVASGGAADALAAAFDLKHVTGFGPVVGEKQVKLVTFVPAEQVDEVASVLSEAGGGRIGNYGGCTFRAEGVGTFIPGAGAQPAVGRVGTINYEKETRLEMVAPSRLSDRLVSVLVAAHPYEEPAFDVYEVAANFGLAGRVGRLPASRDVAKMADEVESVLGSRPRLTTGARQRIETLAVLPGSGGSLIAAAAASGADAYLTGDVGHHESAEGRDLGLTVIDPGHAATERPGVVRLVQVVASLGAETVDLSHDPTPWRAS